jgi:hypothetical protein
MILGAEAFLYPRSCLAFFEKGTMVDYDNQNVPVTVPDLPGFRTESYAGSLRFIERKNAGTIIDPSIPVEYIQKYTNKNIKIDLNCNSYRGYVKPSYLSFVFGVVIGTNTNRRELYFEPGFIQTDFRLISFEGKERRPSDEQLMFEGIAGYNGDRKFYHVALGRWFRMRMFSPVWVIGQLFKTETIVSSERECRISCASVSSAIGNPGVYVKTSGQTYPVIVDADGGQLAVSQGGCDVMGDGVRVELMTSRDFGSGPSYITFYFSVNVEVPYGL